MRNIKSLFYLTLLITLFSCKDKANEKIKDQGIQLDFHNSQSIMIPLPSGIDNINESYQPFGSNNVYFLSKKSLSLYRLNLNSNTIDSIAYINDTSYYDAFIINEENEKLYIFNEDLIFSYNFQGEVIDTFDLEDKCEENSNLVVLDQQFLPDIKDNKLYIHNFPNIEEAYQSKDFFIPSVLKSVNLNTSECTSHEVFYPNNHKNNCYGMNYIPEKIQLDKSKEYQIGMSYAYNDSLFVYDIKSGEQNQYFFGSKILQPKFKHLSFDKIDEYNQVVFDKLYIENNQYLFSKSFPLAGYIARSLLIKGENQQEIICLFDDDFNYIGESNGIWKSYILFDSSEGIKSLRFDKEANRMVLNTISWTGN